MESASRSDKRLTYDDFLRFPDDGLRHEIIDGVHYVTQSPSLRHQDLVGRSYLAIANFLAAHPDIGRVFLSPLDVVFSHYDVVEPDLLFVAGDQLEIMTEKNIQGAPAIVIEGLSRGTRRRDRHAKRQLFARGGVREYWLVDPERTCVTVYRRVDGSFAETAPLAARDNAALTTPLMPGFALAIAELFAPSL